jgi:hypothetical protein
MAQVLAGNAATANAVDGQPYERAALMLSVNEKRSFSGGAESSEILNHVMVTHTAGTVPTNTKSSIIATAEKLPQSLWTKQISVSPNFKL